MSALPVGGVGPALNAPPGVDLAGQTIPPAGALTKAARAVNGDDWFIERVQAACDLAGTTYTKHLGITVAMAVHESIVVATDMSVNAFSVTDEAIIAAVQAYEAPA